MGAMKAVSSIDGIKKMMVDHITNELLGSTRLDEKISEAISLTKREGSSKISINVPFTLELNV